jgi:S1-C subfamily serine protease
MKWYRFKNRIFYTVCLLICFGSITSVLSKQVITFGTNPNSPQSSVSPLTPEQLQQLAQTITVKISSKELLGSGTLLQRKGQIYTVITNAHVLRSAKPPYRIQTADGRIYQAAVLQVKKLKDDDLAMLQFKSPDVVYPVATIRDTSDLQVGDEVFVGGFVTNLSSGIRNPNPLPRTLAEEEFSRQVLPASEEGAIEKVTVIKKRATKNNFVFTSGKISLLLDRALAGGYQIGYTNEVRKGMSGAPLLNVYGEVLGINSLRQDPLWDTPEVYQDGGQPEAHLQEIITRSSMAVPIRQDLLQTQSHRGKHL